MSETEFNQVDVTKLTSFESVLECLHELERTLPACGLNQFGLFNTAYIIVTGKIKKTVDDDRFDDPVFVEHFCVSFARLYVQAVNQAASYDPAIPTAWGKLSAFSAADAMPRFMPLLMGANAHINHDLPLVLFETMNVDAPDDFLADIRKLDRILMESGEEIIGTFDEPKGWVQFVKRRMQFLYYRPIMYTVLLWRIRAYHAYELFKKRGGIGHEFEQRSIDIAHRYLQLRRLFT